MCIFFSNSKIVKLKDEGKIVEKITKMLQNHGSSIKITDKYTIGVKSAVTSFQKKHDLIPSGVVDKGTWKALKKKPENIQNGSKSV